MMMMKKVGTRLLSLLAASLFLLPGAAFTQDVVEQPSPTVAETAKKPQIIRVGIYVLNIGKFDLSTGAYTVDFYLSMTSDEPFEKNTFEFMNGRPGSIELVDDKPNEKFYRIQANLFQNVSLKPYPFDSHILTVEMEEKSKSTNEIVYVHDPSQTGIDDYVTFVGWELVGKPRGRVVPHYYPTSAETFARYVFEIEIRRTPLAAILKAFLPVSFILIVGLLSLVIAVDKVPLRLGMNTSTLLAAVMFHLNLTSSLPPVGYLTFADRFMIVTYVSLILCLASTLWMMRHTENKEEEVARRIFRISFLTVPGVTLVMYVALFLWMRFF